MKKSNFLTAVAFSLVACAFAVNAQTANYSGTWALDLSQSKLDERMRIESMTLTVAQTADDITVSGETKRLPPPADASAPAGGPPRGRGGMGADPAMKYTLDGKETKTEIESPRGKVPQTLSATMNAGKLSLSRAITMSTQAGEMTQLTKEAWSLSPDGKTLTIVRDTSSARGNSSNTLVFMKK